MSDDSGSVSHDDWRVLAERSLRGRDLAGLVGSTRDGIEVRPLYTGGPAPPAAVRAAADPRRAERGWDVRSRHRVGADAGEGALDAVRRQVDDDLTGGATSVELEAGEGVTLDALDRVTHPPTREQRSSVTLDALDRVTHPPTREQRSSVTLDALDRVTHPPTREQRSSVTLDALDRVLAGVDLAETAVALAPHGDLGTADTLAALASRRGSTLAAGSSLGLDPAGEWGRSDRVVDCAEAAAWVSCGPDGLGPGVRAFTVDATRYADAGATEAQALGWATATGIEYLRGLVGAGLPVDTAAGLIGFRFAATADQFVTIAALRAARVMWDRVVTASGGSGAAARQYQHAVTASCIYSRRDPWVNLLRGAAATLAAGAAGADAVTVLPFDHASGTAASDDALGRRLARNTQLLLLEESHLARTGDPAGGSFYVESLTGELARAAWGIMQSTEAAGGIGAVIADGSLEAAVDQRWDERLEALGTRREPLTGVSEYPSLDDAAAGPTYGNVAAPVEPGLPVRRLAQPFEDLCDTADRHRLATGERPAVWVAALGPAAAHSERTAWVQSLLAVGGIEARGGEGVDSPIAAAADFAASGLTAAVITGSDDWLRQRGPATASALSEGGAALVAAVCDPATPAGLLNDLQASGASELWYPGIDAVATLKRLHHILGVA